MREMPRVGLRMLAMTQCPVLPATVSRTKAQKILSRRNLGRVLGEEVLYVIRLTGVDRCGLTLLACC